MENFSYILILLSCSVIFIVICRRLHLPPIIGYLLVGVLVGPGGFQLIEDIEKMHTLAEFGIVFLMFTLGLEFSIPRLMATKRVLLGVGGMQVFICTLLGMACGWLFDVDLNQAFIIGGALALSSTAVVIKQLGEQKEQHLSHGHMSINILLFQDLAAVFYLIVIPAMAGHSDDLLHITFLKTFATGILTFIFMALVGLWVLRPLFHEVAKAHSTELFMIATLLVVLSAAGVTHYLGLSMALGAFLAGLMLGETEFRHQIELDIRPFRDVLLGLFFVVIGAYFELRQLPEIWLQVLCLLFFLLVAKGLSIIFVAKVFGKLPLESAFRTGLILAHGGEFGFVLLSEAIDKNIVLSTYRPAIFAAIVISVMITPLIIRFNRQITNLLFKNPVKSPSKDFPPHRLQEHAAELKNHVILCGFGRVGQILGRFLDQENIPWLALDLDPMRISKASIAGEHSFYGDATHPSTLAAAGLSRARMVVLTFSDEASALEVLMHVRTMRLDVPVFVRTRDDSNLEAFQKAGATEVVPESLEGSIMLASHLLLTLGISTSKIISKVRRIHTDRYEILRGIYKGNDDFSMLEDQEGSRRSLHSLFVSEGAHAIELKLADLVDPSSGPVVKAITRGNNRIPEPDLDMIIQEGDVIVIFATPEETLLLEEKILQGS